MANDSTTKAKLKVLSVISTVHTLLEQYPKLMDGGVAFDLGRYTSFGFILELLSKLGLTERALMEKCSELLTGKAGESVLRGIEQAVKAILIANIKKMFTCSMNPILPDSLMDRYEYKPVEGGDPVQAGGGGISIDLDTVDLFGMLERCPYDRVGYYGGDLLYFDTERYDMNSVWKSNDFNAFLWYIKNKGPFFGDDVKKSTWDNRVQYEDANDAFRNAFFNTDIPEGEESAVVSTEDTTGNKKRIIRCEYVEDTHDIINRNVVKVFINPDRYAKKYGLKIGDSTFKINKTAFEFNYDYIQSLKLLDSKVLVTSIVNAVFNIVDSVAESNLGGNLTLNYSIKRDMVQARAAKIIRRMEEAADNGTETTQTCYFSFSNDDYDRALEEAQRRHAGTYEYNGTDVAIDTSAVTEAITKISKAGTAVEQTETIYNVFDTILATAAENGYVSEEDRFNFALGIIYKIMNETVTQIIMQVLTPKVAILFRINSVIMGDLDPQSGSWDEFMRSFENVMTETVREIRDVILRMLLEWLRTELLRMRNEFAAKIGLEKIEAYRRLIEQLLGLIKMARDIFNSDVNGRGLYAIDNVDYADIVPNQVAPKKEDIC